MFADSHIHLTHRQFDGEVPCVISLENDEKIVYMNRNELMKSMKEHGIGFVVESGIDLASNEKILALAKKQPHFVYPVIGVHPTRTFQTKWKARKEVEALANDPCVVAIGELGLDYHYERKEQHRFKQKMWFIWQLKLADRLNLPLVLHIRMANQDAIKILRRHKKQLHGGVCHCFNNGPDVAKIYTEEFGLMLGIGGSLLNEYGKELEQAVIETPLEYLILETDGPYVKAQKPEDVSGKQWKKARNTSFIIPDVAKRIAELKGMDVQEVERVTTENTKRLFGVSGSV